MYAILAAILIILICILFAPLKVKITFTDMKLGVKVYLFNIPVFKLNKNESAMTTKPPAQKAEAFKTKTESLGDRLKRFANTFSTAVKLLRRYVGIKDINFNLIVGTGDAAVTAISVGALWAAVYTVLGIVGNICFIDNQKVEISPDYAKNSFSIDAMCIIKSRIAYIIFIAITILIKIKSRKGKEE